jgi:superfamily II DNA/RNA helicase
MHVVCIGFSSDMEGILQAMGPKRQTLLFSATISSNIEGCVEKNGYLQMIHLNGRFL